LERKSNKFQFNKMKKEYVEMLASKVKGNLIAVASDEMEDRQGDKLKVEDWDFNQFRKNPVLQFAHDYHTPPVGVVKNLKIENRRVIFKPVFHEITPFAKEVKEMYKQGIMKAFSVGYMPNKRGKMELLEISCVPIGSNRNALTVAKEFTDDDDEQVKSWVKNEVAGVKKNIEDKKEEKKEIEEKTEEKEVKKHIKIKKLKKKRAKVTDEDILKQAVSILRAEQKLLPVDGEDKPERSERKVDDRSHADEIIHRALQKIAKNSNFALNQLKKLNKK